MPRGKPKGAKTLFNEELHCGAVARGRNLEILTTQLVRSEIKYKTIKPTDARYAEKRAVLKKIILQLGDKIQSAKDNPDDRPCVKPKGMHTEHTGEGYCCYHCQCHGRRGWHNITGNAYRQIRNKRLQEAYDAVEQQTIDIMDLVPGVKLLMSMAIVFFEDINRRKNLKSEDLREGANIIDKIGRQVERISAIQLKAGVVTHAAVVLLTQQMADIMMIAAQDQNGQSFDAQAFVDAVKSGWSGLSIDSSTKALPIPRHSREAV